MRYFIPALLLSAAIVVHAHLPVVVSPQHVDDVVQVERPEVSWAYYGELTGFPHTYEIQTEEPIKLYTHILEPDIEGVTENHSGIIVRARENGRGVEEVARLHPEDADWESFYEFAGGDRYLSGPEFEQDVVPGTYRIEVSTPSNEGKYVLVIGHIEDFSGVGYFETVSRIYEVKQFFGKSIFSMLLSPFVFIPLIVIVLFSILGRWIYKRKYG